MIKIFIAPRERERRSCALPIIVVFIEFQSLVTSLAACDRIVLHSVTTYIVLSPSQKKSFLAWSDGRTVSLSERARRLNIDCFVFLVRPVLNRFLNQDVQELEVVKKRFFVRLTRHTKQRVLLDFNPKLERPTKFPLRVQTCSGRRVVLRKKRSLLKFITLIWWC